MPLPIKVFSLNRPLLLISTGVTVIALLVSFIILSSIFLHNAKQQLIDNIHQWSSVLRQTSIEYIISDDHDGLQKKLERLQLIPEVSYSHIYKLTPSTQKPKFFASYNKNSNYPAIPDQIDKIKLLDTIKFSSKYAEFISPIKNKDTLYGYLYVQVNIGQLASLKTEVILACILILIVSICSSILITQQGYRSIVQAITNIVDTMQQVSQRKNFNLRCQPEKHKEFDILSRNINIMLNRTEKHISKRDKHEQHILNLNHQLESKVDSRTEALKESNQELLSTLEKLHQFQGQLVENEKMASLGDMVAGVAHEVNTPIGLGVTASSLLGDQIEDIQKAFKDKTLKSSQLKKFLELSQVNVEIISRNLTRAADLISSFKQVAVDQSSQEVRVFNVKGLINEVYLTLAPELRNMNYKIHLDCEENLVVKTMPGPLNQVFINLIMNSKIHGFENNPEGNIYITVMKLGQQLNINYRDDGIGIDESIKSKVFEPFVTTKRGEGGSGLGLHLVYNLVTQALGGSIEISSEVGKGANFELNIPVK